MLIHLNGNLIDAKDARVSVFDRGFLFGDGVYEGLRTTGSERGPIVIGRELHEERLGSGLAEARIKGFPPGRMTSVALEVCRANRLDSAFVYLQVTRGTPQGPDGPERPRIPPPGLPPTVVAFATAVPSIDACTIPEVRRVALRPDTRWARGRLKSISLLGGVLAAMEADELGCDDAILVRDGLVVEGTATNVFFSLNGRLVTPSLKSAPMLAGVTRAMLIEVDPSIVEKPVTIEELRSADEVMIVGTKTMVASVVSIDGLAVGSGGRAAGPGPAARRLLATLVGAIRGDVARQLAEPAGGDPEIGSRGAAHVR